jgi:GNAT superfamily N-acetyltransferase
VLPDLHLCPLPGCGRQLFRKRSLVIGHLDADREVVAMALAEHGRAEHGAGAVIPGYGHVSMVFVHPDLWGRGLGRQLLKGLHERASERGWSRTTLWTRASNARARRMYEGQDIEGQAMRGPLAAVIPSSSSSVKHSDRRRSVEDRPAVIVTTHGLT